MSDEFDPGLRRLFAATAEAPADEAFISAVTARTARERRIASAARGVAGPALVAMLLGALAAGAGLVLGQGVRMITPLLNASPMGYAAGLGLVVAGVVCFRLLGPFALQRS